MKPSAFPRLARTSSPVACVLATAIAILLAQPSAQAANTYTFTPTSAGTYDWTAVGNWSASGVAVSANDATVAFFSDITTALTGAVTIHTDPATLTLNTLTLNGLAPATAAAANSIGTAGNTWTFDGTTPTLNLNGKSGTAALSYTLKPNIVLNQPLTFAGVGSAGLALSGVISGSGMGITHNGIQNVGDKASKITLNGSAVNTFTGGVTINGCNTGYGAAAINGSTLLLDFANLGTTGTDLINSGNALTLGGGTLALQGKGSATDSQTFASTTLSPKTGSRINLLQNSATSLSVDLKAITRNAGSTLFFSSLPATSGIIAKTSNSNTKGILGTWAVGGYGTAYYQTVDVSGRIVSFGPGTIPTQSNYSDVQDPNGNYYLNINKTTVTLGSNITANTINLPGGSTSTLAIGNNNVTLNGILFCGGTTKFTSTGSGKVVIGADNELVVCCFNGNGKTLSIDVPIVNGAAGNSAVTIAGDNFGNGGANENVFFTGAANTYTGPTTVNSATLVLNKAANVIAVPGDLNIAGGTVDLKNDNQIASTANLTFSGTGQFGDYFHSNYGLVKAQTVASVTVTGNQGGFYIAPGGALTVSAALFITGNNGAGPLGNGTIAYRMDGTATMTVGSLSLDNSFFYVGKASADTPTLTLNGDFTGANTSSLNTTATAPKFVLFGSGTHTHNFNITSGTTTIAPPISETATTTAALTKTGAGTLALTGTNTYSGDTTVTEGILAVNGSSIKDSNKLIISGGKVQPTGTEVVDTLFFGTAQQAAGTWGATGSGATHIDNSHFAGAAGVVSVTSGPVGPVGGYDAWAATNAGSEAASLDFDKDGVPNGVEYFMGIGPTDPVFTPTPTVVNGKITWPHSATATDITYRVLTSENLTSWSDVTAQTTDAGGFLEYILPKTSPELFVRLEVVAP